MTRRAMRLAVSFFIFDILPQYPTKFDIGYWGKLLISGDLSDNDSPISGREKLKRAKLRKILYFSGGWYLCRGPPDCRCSYPFYIDKIRRTNMFDKRSDYALNRVDKEAIVCQSVSGSPVRLTRSDFSSEAEFNYWKAWSDNDYHEIQLAGREDDDCIPLMEQMDAPSSSAEEHFLEAVLNAERAGQRTVLTKEIRAALTERQYRRLCLYFLDGKTQAQIADIEEVGQRRVSTSITRGAKIVEKILEKFLCSRG